MQINVLISRMKSSTMYRVLLLLLMLNHGAATVTSPLKECLQPVRLRIFHPPCPAAKVPKTIRSFQGLLSERDEAPSCSSDGGIAAQDESADSVCSFISHAILADIPVFDVALFNHGMCTSGMDIQEGMFTPENARKILPYNNQLVALRLSGKDLKQTIEEGLKAALRDENPIPGAYPVAAGIEFDIENKDGTCSAHIPIESIQLSNVRILGHSCTWDVLVDDQYYTVLTNTYLADGGDEYTNFRTKTKTRTPTGISEVDSFWFHAFSTCNLEYPWKTKIDKTEEDRKIIYRVGTIGPTSTDNVTLVSFY